MIVVQVDIQGPDPPPQHQYRFSPNAMESVVEAVTDLETRGVVIIQIQNAKIPYGPLRRKRIPGDSQLVLGLLVLISIPKCLIYCLCN